MSAPAAAELAAAVGWTMSVAIPSKQGSTATVGAAPALALTDGHVLLAVPTAALGGVAVVSWDFAAMLLPGAGRMDGGVAVSMRLLCLAVHAACMILAVGAVKLLSRLQQRRCSGCCLASAAAACRCCRCRRTNSRRKPRFVSGPAIAPASGNSANALVPRRGAERVLRMRGSVSSEEDGIKAGFVCRCSGCGVARRASI